MFFSFFFFLWGIYVFLFFNVHYVFILLGLELILLSIFFSFFVGFLGSLGLVGFLFFLLFLVCMGGFSISLLVSLYRGMGRDWWGCKFLF